MEAFKDSMLNIAVALSCGLVFGALGSAVGRRLRRGRAQPVNPDAAGRLRRAFIAVMGFLSKAVYLVLGVALVWTLYFLVLGVADASLTEWAANAATLIVSVITVFSIMIAFYEFMNRGK